MERFLEQFSKIPPAQKAAGLAGAVVLLIIGVYTFWVLDYQATMEEHASTIQTQEQQLLKLQTQAQYRSQYMREVERLRQRLREAEEQLPKKAEVPKLLRDISYEANQSGLRVDRFEIRPEQQRGEFAAVPVQMKVAGSYHEIAVFLDRLSKMSRIVNATNLIMSAPKLENKKIVLTSSFDATTYRFLESGEVSTADDGKKKKKKGKEEE